MRVWQAILAVVVLGAMLGVYFWSKQGASSENETAAVDPGTNSFSGLGDRLVLPAKPYRPRPITLDPDSFTDPGVKEAYQAAKDTPEALEHVACYCGCFGTAGHRNNLDCFKDSHGVT